ncbi:MAG: hypothetical protein M3Y73_04805, partial [Actinomycetota bacterium]|nr:hypothetical protein [Actinomycetota bacterium]
PTRRDGRPRPRRTAHHQGWAACAPAERQYRRQCAHHPGQPSVDHDDPDDHYLAPRYHQRRPPDHRACDYD